MKKAFFWMLAVLITCSSAVYQRLTGPTYPISAKTVIAGTTLRAKLPRGAENTEDCLISIAAPNRRISGRLLFKRAKTDDPWTEVPFEHKEYKLTAFLPRQPAAGKLAYRVIVAADDKQASLTGESSVIIRFKGSVPAAVLIPHILIMFLAMLFSTRTGLAALDKKGDPRRLVPWTVALLLIGGFVLGPIVQKYAFGVWWSGFPLGTDLTDSKTLMAALVWISALIAGRKGKSARGWILTASLITLIIFLIPHSLLGSEIDYTK